MFVRINKALDASLAKRNSDDKGFTLIELLVVVLIIGVLSAIAIPIFLGQQNGAKDATAKSDLANAKLAYVAYYAANPSGATPTATTLKDFGYVASSSNAANQAKISSTSTATTFCIDIVSETTSTFSLTQATSTPATTPCP